MPYELTFTKQVTVTDRDQYINDCCVGGDIVRDRLFPAVQRWGVLDVQTEQEDWGWFIWFRREGVKLAIDIFTDDPEKGEFRVHLTSRVRRWLVGDSIADVPELDRLRALVESELAQWVDGPCRTIRLGKNDV